MLTKLKEMKSELEKLSAARAEDQVKNAEAIADLEKQIEEAQNVRKSVAGEVMPSDKAVEKATMALKAAYLKGAILGKKASDMEGYKAAAEIVEKALVPADVTNWVAEAFAKDVIEALELELKVATMFDKITIPNGYGSLSIPARTSNLTAYLIQPAADAIESVITDGKITFATQKIKTLTVLADEANEELVTSVLELSKKELIRSIARGVETAVIMGDTETADANSVKKVCDGIFKVGKAAQVDAGGDDLTLADIANARLAMGTMGINTSELALILTPRTYMKAVSNIPEFLTMDKIGDKATLLSGAISSIFGISIIVSEYIPEDLAADGTDDGSGATTAAILVNAKGFLRAERTDGILSETDRNIVNDSNLMTSKYSFTFKNVMANGEVACSTIINLLP